MSFINTQIRNLERWCWCSCLQGSGGDTDTENRLLDAAGEGGRESCGGGMETRIPALCQVGGQWGFAVGLGELKPAPCDNLGGVGGRLTRAGTRANVMQAETNTALQSDHPPVRNKQIRKKKTGSETRPSEPRSLPDRRSGEERKKHPKSRDACLRLCLVGAAFLTLSQKHQEGLESIGSLSQAATRGLETQPPQ